MKKIRNYLFATIVSLATASACGKPEIALYHIAKEARLHTAQRNTSAFLNRIFEAVDRGEVLSAEDFTSLLPNRYSLKSVDCQKDRGCISVECFWRDIPFKLLLERNDIALYQKLPGCEVWISLLPLYAKNGGIDISVPSEEQRLMRYAYGHYDIFSKHLYELLNNRIRTDGGTDPFGVQMRDTLERFGHALPPPVEDGEVPPFALNVENIYAFLKKWCIREKRKGKSVYAMTTDIKPLYGLVFKNGKALCPRIREIFEPTVFAVCDEIEGSYLQIRFPRETGNRGKCRILAVERLESIGKNVLLVSVWYLGLRFRIRLEQNRTETVGCYGCDRVEAEYLHD